MSAAPVDVVAAASERLAGLSHWERVLRELVKRRTTRAGLWCIAALLILAVYAPFVSLDQPLAWNEGAGWSFPLFGALVVQI